MAQSLTRREDLEVITAGYGLVVVDECHHLPAATLERCVRRIPARRWIGLTATPYRQDGLEAIMAMHCGPIRHQITSKAAPGAALRLRLVIHDTHHAPPGTDAQLIHEAFRALVDDRHRTAEICRDVIDALGRSRHCLVLTQWIDHVQRLRDELRLQGFDPLVLQGGMGKKASAAALEALAAPGQRGGLLLVATGPYLGEGFDCPRLDTLFLAFPLAYKGRLVQYVGRVLRTAEGKDSIEVHDYVDRHVPVLARMHAKRLATFANLGFDTPRPRHQRR